MDICKEEELLYSRLEELAEKSEKRGIYTFSDFLTPTQLQTALQLSKIRQTSYSVWGGTDFTERKLLRFGNETDIGYEMPYPIQIIYIKSTAGKFSQELSHRDFLGSVMNLGIKRQVIGDIFVENNEAYMFVKEQIASFITENLHKVKGTPVLCGIYDIDQVGGGEKLEALRPKTVQETTIAASERLDAVIASVYSLSRGETAELIKSGRVQINHIIKYEVGIPLKEHDTVSVRGKGRFLFKGRLGVSRKGRERISIERYIT